MEIDIFKASVCSIDQVKQAFNIYIKDGNFVIFVTLCLLIIAK